MAKKASKKSATKKTTKKKTTAKKSTTKKATKSAAKKTTKKKTTKKAGAKKTSKKAKKVMPTTEQIEVRAFQVWERKGKPEGQCEANWKEAEAELIAELNG